MELTYINTENFSRIDRETIQQKKIPAALLMENAGNEIGRKLKSIYSRHNLRRILIISGRGNNGGDGLVAARYLARNSVPVSLLIVGRADKSSPLFKEKYNLLRDFNIPSKEVTVFTASVKTYLQKSDLLVDALFGTGLSRNIKGVAEEVITFVNSLNCTKVALDIPSGLQCALEKSVVFRADYTVTVQEYKHHFLLPCYACFCGNIITIKIDFPKAITDKYIRKVRIPLPDKQTDKGDYEHKLTRGHSLILAGSKNYPGALRLAADSAAHNGSSYLTLYSPAAYNNIYAPQVVSRRLSADFFNIAAWDMCRAKIEASRFILCGPGIDRMPETTLFLEKLLQFKDKYFILDADALFHLKKIITQKKKKLPRRNILITPHIGEFAELLSVKKTALYKNIFKHLKTFYDKYKIKILLKDAYIFYQHKQLSFFPFPNKFLAKAGSGDILAGMILAFFSLYNDFDTAVEQAVREFIRKAGCIREKYGARASVYKMVTEEV
ncbi:MAG TPA: NAD(P)H-hydrate epimerase [Spirochaetota bacterium]|nr:NAD(P)H-hydrate epimerase [Spirochaetota bacterium]